jgi:hypothetical protein
MILLLLLLLIGLKVLLSLLHTTRASACPNTCFEWTRQLEKHTPCSDILTFFLLFGLYGSRSYSNPLGKRCVYAQYARVFFFFSFLFFSFPTNQSRNSEWEVDNKINFTRHGFNHLKCRQAPDVTTPLLISSLRACLSYYHRPEATDSV